MAEKLPTLLSQFAEIIGERPYMVCGTPTIPDFKIFELLAKCKIAFGDDCLDVAYVLLGAWCLLFAACCLLLATSTCYVLLAGACL